MTARLASKSMDKLTALLAVAEKFIAAGGLDQFAKIEVQLTWDNINADAADGVEGVVAPLVFVKLQK